MIETIHESFLLIDSIGLVASILFSSSDDKYRQNEINQFLIHSSKNIENYSKRINHAGERILIQLISTNPLNSELFSRLQLSIETGLSERNISFQLIPSASYFTDNDTAQVNKLDIRLKNKNSFSDSIKSVHQLENSLSRSETINVHEEKLSLLVSLLPLPQESKIGDSIEDIIEICKKYNSIREIVHHFKHNS
ncbi:uncharacterized protein ASCRUDRAFT_71931 [Ascoidea rubescens DSM 1968]|uniref:Uncharacterized protein n=1 Tax=Ascoidea rubescens DSM 1968 TaxID=1344418 RepID=A0A1D2VCK1_9ASCO|nr:hypothetical protein ASCRUDRAFT_71931 [Ascoidea rubescens DSM 1968]ODV59213.1 hypothetical protein ASCRUDRAFT_71931 [Ascoidea rubescens DSM 1968]